MSCARFYPPAVQDEAILALFTSSAGYKARQVTRLLHFDRSRHRIITAQLNHLVQQELLMQLPSLSVRYSQPFYALAASPAPSSPHPPAPATPPPEPFDVLSLQCVCCQSALPTVVCLPCRHQRC
jgi:hypothetical protein